MTLSHRYPDFGELDPSGQRSQSVAAGEVEDQKLESFETGYRAGWDDAIKAQADEQAQISSDLAQNLQDISFSYHEALSKLTQALEPLMTRIVDTLLPDTARALLGPHILGVLDTLIKTEGETGVEIVIAPENEAVLAEIMARQPAGGVTLRLESTLGPGQAFVRIGTAEREIDLDTVTAGIAAAVAAHFQHPAQEHENG